jgi:S-adenosylmethionine:diacylglycerol 3-amino-3-carboxypropyl transferase
MTIDTAWEHGRFDAGRGPRKILFGRMYEDTAIELDAFRSAERVFCIASAGCTAMALAPAHDVVAVDINPVQLEYARERIAGRADRRGVAEKLMDAIRTLAPLAGWRRRRVLDFLDARDPEEQLARWHELDTLRFRMAFDGLLSIAMLRAVYASPFLAFLPRRLGRVMRGRMERCFRVHANRDNPYARMLLLGERIEIAPPPRASRVELVHSDAAGYLEAQPAGSFDGFTLSNILDGAGDEYRKRLFAAVKHAAAPDAKVVLRSFGEPPAGLSTNRASDDRSMLWGVVDVRPAASLD